MSEKRMKLASITKCVPVSQSQLLWDASQMAWDPAFLEAQVLGRGQYPWSCCVTTYHTDGAQRGQWLVGNQWQEQGLEPGLLPPIQAVLESQAAFLPGHLPSAPESWTGAWIAPFSSPRQLKSLPPWIFPTGSLVCFLILSRLDTLLTDLREVREERECFANGKYPSRPSGKQVHAVSPCSVGKGQESKRPGLHLQERATWMPDRCWIWPRADWGGEMWRRGKLQSIREESI